MFKIMTLNMWGYYDWEDRKQNILSLVNEQNPDVITLQEVQLNHAFSYFPQSDFIADNCGYENRVFAPTYPRNDQIDKSGDRTQRTSYGLAIISRHPIITSETHFLQLYPDHDEECSVVFAKIQVNGKMIEVCNVHFANSDKHSDLHLKELMDVCKQRDQKPIILGDFNNFHLDTYKGSILKDYTLTTDVASYTSMPKDNGTLDYIVVPTADYKISTVLCPDEYVSDHKALIATLGPKSGLPHPGDQ